MYFTMEFPLFTFMFFFLNAEALGHRLHHHQALEVWLLLVAQVAPVVRVTALTRE